MPDVTHSDLTTVSGPGEFSTVIRGCVTSLGRAEAAMALLLVERAAGLATMSLVTFFGGSSMTAGVEDGEGEEDVLVETTAAVSDEVPTVLASTALCSGNTGI